MCRLLGYASPRPLTTREVLGDGQSAVFQDMAELHRDGWGSAWLGVGGVTAETSPATGHADPELARLLSEDAATARITHLRMASDGMQCAPENTHPFVADGIAFAHNGGLIPTDELERHISPAIRATLRGITDSERYFAVIRSRLAEGADLVQAVVDAVRELRPHYPHASMNALVLSPTHLIAVHASEAARIPHAELDASGIPEDRLPADHRTAYYLMRKLQRPDGTIAFASSGLDVTSWEPLPAETVVAVELSTGTLSQHPIDPARALAA